MFWPFGFVLCGFYVLFFGGLGVVVFGVYFCFLLRLVRFSYSYQETIISSQFRNSDL